MLFCAINVSTVQVRIENRRIIERVLKSPTESIDTICLISSLLVIVMYCLPRWYNDKSIMQIVRRLRFSHCQEVDLHITIKHCTFTCRHIFIPFSLVSHRMLSFLAILSFVSLFLLLLLIDAVQRFIAVYTIIRYLI